MADGGAPTTEQLLQQAIQASLAQQQTSGAAQYRPWGTVPTPFSVPHGAVTDSGERRSGITTGGGRIDWPTHQNEFVDKWNSDAKWRTQLVTLALKSGLPGMSSSAGPADFMNVWDTVGQISSMWADNGRQLTPMQVLSFLAGQSGKDKGLNSLLASIGGGKKQTQTSTSTNVSYDISNPETAKALTNAVLSAALGREAQPGELASYRSALNAAERANPARSTSTNTTTYDSAGNAHSSSSSTSQSGGLDQAGKQQVLLDKAQGTAEGQAYQTNDVFNKAMQVLAGL